MADLYSEGPIYSEIGYSKGPKSTYYGLNDQQLPASVLNVPQTDSDDEWGRTQRISDERTLDYLAKIYKTLFDPYGSLCGIILEPGTEGSEMNVAKNMVRLIGRAGLEDGVFDLDIPSLTLGDIIINGSDNKIYNGSTSEISSDSLKLADNLELYSASSDEGRLRFKSSNYLRFYNNDSADPYTEIIVNGKAYKFTEDTLTIPSGGTITATSLTMGGTLTSRNIVPAANNTYTVGTSGSRYANIYSVLGNFIGVLTADSVLSQNLGDPSGAVVICGISITLSDSDQPFGGVILNSNRFSPICTSTVSLGESSLRYSNIYSVEGNFSGTLTTGTVVPFSDNMYDIGTISEGYSNIYGKIGHFDLYINTPIITSNLGLQIYATSNIDIYSQASHLLTFSDTGITTNRDILAGTSDTYDIGKPALKFSKIYVVDVYATHILSSNLGISSSGTVICGTSITLLDVDSDKNLYFENDIFRPSVTEYVDIGSASLKFKNIYALRGYFDTLVSSNWFMGPAFGDPSSNVTVCGGNYVSLKSSDAGYSVRIDSEGFRPGSSGDVSLGSASKPFKELWLWDATIATAVRVHVCGGGLQPI